MYPDFKDLLSAFHAHNVKYLIVWLRGFVSRAAPRHDGPRMASGAASADPAGHQSHHERPDGAILLRKMS
jgi:hypothetical protein